MHRNTRLSLTVFAALTAFVFCADGKGHHPKGQPPQQQDEIQVIGHLPVASGPVVRFLTTEHYGHEYLYAEHSSGQTITLIDLSRPDCPAVLADMAYPAGGDEDLVAAAGNAALVVAQQSAAAPPSHASNPATFRIMSFADPLHPAVKQEFDAVTAMARDDKRGLIFLANSQGIWILQQQYAVDPETARLRKDIEHSVFDTP